MRFPCAIPNVFRRAKPAPAITLDSLPVEMKAGILRADADAALLMLGTSRGWAELVIGLCLASVRDHFQGSLVRTAAFVNAAQAKGRTASQILRLAKIMAMPDKANLADYACLVELGMLTPRTHNALARAMLALLCKPEVLTFAFTRPLPLLRDEELYSRDAVTDPRKRQSIEHHPTGLHLVLLRFAGELGMDQIIRLGSAQLAESKRGSKRLLPVPDVDKEDTERAGQNAFAVGVSLKMFFSGSALRAVDGNTAAVEGILYRTAFRGGASGGKTPPQDRQPKPSRTETLAHCIVM